MIHSLIMSMTLQATQSRILFATEIMPHNSPTNFPRHMHSQQPAL